MTPSARTTLAHLALLAALRVALSVLVLRLGFSSISDDDFARVTIAQTFAAHPRFDPSGTSWLPLPFWCSGAWLALFGSTLAAARTGAIAVAVLATLGLYAAMRAAGLRPLVSFLATMGATLMPVSAMTGVATVPELPTAVLCACALLLLRRHDRAGLLAASMCVLPATLSRYEAWPVALIVAASAWVGRRAGVPRDGRAMSPRLRVAATVTALGGIAAWLAWNRIAHGDALHFHSRVSAFWFASGGSHGAAIAQLLRGYPWTTIIGVPAWTTLLLGALWLVRDPAALASWRRPLAGASLVVAVLTLMQATGGAPTHHPERTLMLVWMVGWAFAVDLLGQAPVVKRIPAVSLGVAACVAALLARQILQQVPSAGTDRRAEVQAGTWLRHHAASERVLVDPHDYGYFAIIAAAGTPSRVLLSRSIDPRDAVHPSPFEGTESLRSRVGEANARWLVVRSDKALAARALGDVRQTVGGWDIVQVR